MSIEQLKTDLKSISQQVAANPPDTTPAVVTFLQDNLIPWLESFVDETQEMDESIADLVHQAVDVLHPESAAVFASIIAGGLALASELATRAGNDARLLKAIKEYRDLAKQGRVLLEELTLIDDTDGDAEDAVGDDTPSDAPKLTSGGEP